MGKKINDQGDLEDDEENLDEDIRKAQQKELAELLRMLNKIKSFLLEYYKPVEDLTDPGAIHFKHCRNTSATLFFLSHTGINSITGGQLA